MYYLDFLRGLHEAVAPATYLEIGIRNGDSLALARCRAVGIDPEFNLRAELGPDVTLFEESSDEYFERRRPLRALGGERVDMAFIDGMHLAEFALRDFANVERIARWSSVVVFDDILPRDAEMAARDRRTKTWTGDIYKLLGILERNRPDLLLLRVGTQPTGLLLALALDPSSSVLTERYDELLGEIVVPDPQVVPDDVLERRGVLDPQRVLDAGIWSLLRDARAGGVARGPGVRLLRRVAKRDVGIARTGIRKYARFRRPPITA